MSQLYIQWVFYFIFIWPISIINGAVLNCTVYSSILEIVPKEIIGTIAVANSSNEEIFWTHVDFADGMQFPLRFITVITNSKFVSDMYILQLHIYKIPRNSYDSPLWSADSTDKLTRDVNANMIIFHAYGQYPPLSPCLLGVIIDVQRQQTHNLVNSKLYVRIGSMPLIIYNLHPFTSCFPIVFLISNISTSELQNTTIINTVLSNPNNIFTYQGRGRTIFTNDGRCSTIVIRSSSEKSTNISVTMSAYVLTSVQLLGLGVTIRIYEGDYLIYEEPHLIDTLQFPVEIPKRLIPITRADEYVIEATIFGPVDGFPMGITLFQGVTKVRLVPSIAKNIPISMLYTGPKIGTTIIGTIHTTPPNLDTWPLMGSNLALVINNQALDISESAQFIIYNQTFPLEFTMLNVEKITNNNQNIVFIVTITYPDGIVIWQGTMESNRTIHNSLNRLNIGVSIADGFACQTNNGSCSIESTANVNQTCCSQFKCSNSQCQHP